MDDIAVSSSKEEELVPKVKAVEYILSEASLPTYKYISNSSKALEAFTEDRLLLKEKC